MLPRTMENSFDPYITRDGLGRNVVGTLLYLQTVGSLILYAACGARVYHEPH